MNEHLLFKLFLIHASEETQRAFITYTIEYLKWRYGVKTFEDVKMILTTKYNQETNEECATIATRNEADALTEHSAEVL